MAVDAARAGVIDLGHQIAFAHADLDLVEDAGVHLLDDARGLAHIVDFLRRSSPRAASSLSAGAVGEARVRQMADQRGKGGGEK
jgi:hypothetical protein